jgi:hypothetical protein
MIPSPGSRLRPYRPARRRNAGANLWADLERCQGERPMPGILSAPVLNCKAIQPSDGRTLWRLTVGEAFNAKIELQIDQPCQNISWNFITEMPIPEKLDEDASPSASRPQALKESPVRLEVIDQLGNLAGKPLIRGLVAAAMSPPRVSMRAWQQRALWRHPLVSDAMGKLRPQSKRGADFYRIKARVDDEQLNVEPLRRDWLNIRSVVLHHPEPHSVTRQ